MTKGKTKLTDRTKNDFYLRSCIQYLMEKTLCIYYHSTNVTWYLVPGHLVFGHLVLSEVENFSVDSQANPPQNLLTMSSCLDTSNS